MSSDLRIRTLIEFDTGSESVRIDQEILTTVSARDKFDIIKTLADDAADGDVTLFDIDANPVFSASNPPTRMVIFSDADDDNALVLPIAVKLVTRGGDAIALQINRRSPLVFVDTVCGAAGAVLATMTNRIGVVKVRNNNAAPGVGNNDLPVRLLAWKT